MSVFTWSASSTMEAGYADMAKDVDMAKVIGSQGKNAHGLHPTKAQLEEKLPEEFRRNYVGFLLRDLN